MNVDIVVAVWGDWHIAAFETTTLPTALASQNLPGLARTHQCRLRIFTRAKDVERIGRIALLAEARELMSVEVTAMTEQIDVPAPFHLEWWHRAAVEAKARDAVVVNLPPDVVFPDGCVAHLVAPLAKGRAVVLAPPQLRVVEETILGELPRWRAGAAGAIRIGARDSVALGMRHLHPLFAQVVEGNPFGRPGIEHLWPVGAEGFVLCQTTREIIAYNPARCDITNRFLVSNAADMSSVHTSTSAEDGFFLSLAPLMKDFGLVLRDHPVSARFLARWSTHPDNDVPLADFLPEHLVRLEAKPPTPDLWQKTEERARIWVREYQRWRDVFHIWRAARDVGCITAARLVGLAAHVLDVASLFASSAPPVVFLPSEAAFARFGRERLYGMVLPGGETRLTGFLRAHFAQANTAPSTADPSAEFRTLDGKDRTLTRSSGGPRLDGIALSEPARSGRSVVYGLDGILGE